jgi:hypothetical protein
MKHLVVYQKDDVNLYLNNWYCPEADAVVLIGQLTSGRSGNITPVERLDTSRATSEILEAIRWSYT